MCKSMILPSRIIPDRFPCSGDCIMKRMDIAIQDSTVILVWNKLTHIFKDGSEN